MSPAGQRQMSRRRPAGPPNLGVDQAARRPVGPGPIPEADEQQLAFSFTKNLLGDGAGADDLAALFKTVYQALDERSVSYGQGTLQLVVSVDVAQQLADRLEALGISATIKPV